MLSFNQEQISLRGKMFGEEGKKSRNVRLRQTCQPFQFS